MPKASKKPYAAESVDELWQGSSLELLKELHILTRDGKLNADTRRKLKQVYHLFGLIKPALEELFADESEPHVVDLGAGKSYLGFILYDLFFSQQKKGLLSAVEWRPDLVKKSQGLAEKLAFERMRFAAGAIEGFAPVRPVHLVTALHACDTATDDAIAFALKHKARFVCLVPCCQAEVARLLEKLPAPRGLQQLWRHPIHRREFGSNLTNVIRALHLEAQGYKVRVTELIGWEHSLKNEFIFAEKVQASNAQARAQLDELLKDFPIAMQLFQS